jgi:hypothetical protein
VTTVKLRLERLSQGAWFLIYTAIAFAVGLAYLVAAARCAPTGFPLDDAWIHLSYARTLAQTGQFAFAPGRPSTGSTSPLWTAMLSLGFLAGIAPAWWTYLLGLASWLLAAWTAAMLTRRLFPDQQGAAHWVGIACLLEWHLAWAALSGMEVMTFAFLSLLLLERTAARARPIWLGLIGGLLVLTRPEGIVLVALVALALAADGLGALFAGHSRDEGGQAPVTLWRVLIIPLTGLVAGLALLVVPYVVLNATLAGQPFPNTFYAKQAEYRILLEQPLWKRLWRVARRVLVGAQVLLIPGFIAQALRELGRTLAVLRALRTPQPREQTSRDSVPSSATPTGMRAQSVVLLPLAWWGVYHLIYALRLPVDYQHGRYLIPTIPVLIIYGVVGTWRWLQRPLPARESWQVADRVGRRVLVLTLIVLAVGFLFLGGRAYTQDRCIIQREMVDVALWLRANTPPGALIAAHDIGAIGYWADRPLLDLAGLIDPGVIPLMRDEDLLLDYIVDRDARYLVTFPSWYPTMVADDRLEPTYPPEDRRSSERDPMTVYRIER